MVTKNQVLHYLYKKNEREGVSQVANVYLSAKSPELTFDLETGYTLWQVTDYLTERTIREFYKNVELARQIGLQSYTRFYFKGCEDISSSKARELARYIERIECGRVHIEFLKESDVLQFSDFDGALNNLEISSFRQPYVQPESSKKRSSEWCIEVTPQQKVGVLLVLFGFTFLFAVNAVSGWKDQQSTQTEQRQ